jgi:GrpB-like predicted nucleotidyltransferase (UPF0157 family)
VRSSRADCQTQTVPFPDEPFASRVRLSPYQDLWAEEGAALVQTLWRLFPEAAAVDHIGSTAVPGLPAKDCIDAMVQVHSVDQADCGPLLASGFRERPEEWNQQELLEGVTYPKRVFAPPAGGRSVNIHIREVGSPTARYALLFRDYLRGEPSARASWGSFKASLAETVTDLYSYGQIKATVYPLLMTLAEAWAEAKTWRP